MVLALFLGLVVSSAQAQPLEPDPAIAAILESLEPGEGARLPDFRVFGPAEGLARFESFSTVGPGIRDYCRQWVYAPDRGRALYAGGNHGAPHKFDDVWEFDLRANAWVMLHPPDEGVMPSHTWWGLTYDSRRRRLLWMAPTGGIGSWPTASPDAPPLMAYTPESPAIGWAQLPTSPIRISLAGALEYVPSRDVVLWYGNQWNGSGLQSLDPETNLWTELIPQEEVYFDNPNAPPASAIVDLDPRHDVLVGFQGRDAYEYRFDTNEWLRVIDGGLPGAVAEVTGSAAFDTMNGVHLVLSDEGGLFAYDASEDAVRSIPLADFPRGSMLYYDERSNVLVAYDETRAVYVYRHGGGTGVPFDAGASYDAGTMPSDDAGSTASDAGAARRDAGSVTSPSDGGCACTTTRAPDLGIALFLLLLAGPRRGDGRPRRI